MDPPSRRKSIASTVKTIVLSSPVILECMARGIVSYSKLARWLQDIISEEIGTEASLAAVKMALVRFSERLREYVSLEKEVLRIFAETKVSIQTDISVIVVKKDTILQYLHEVAMLMSSSRFFQLLQGFSVFTLIVSLEDTDKLLTLIHNGVIEKRDEQTAILLISPHSIVEMPGVIAYLSLLFALNNINIVQLVSCHNDTLLVVDRKDSLRAFKLIEDIIDLAKKKVKEL